MTWIEREVYAALDEMDIGYVQQAPIGPWIADAYIPTRGIVIECQGDFWHANPSVYTDESLLSPAQVKAKTRDAAKAEWYERNGYALLSLWESEIRAQSAKALLERELGGP